MSSDIEVTYLAPHIVVCRWHRSVDRALLNTLLRAKQVFSEHFKMQLRDITKTYDALTLYFDDADSAARFDPRVLSTAASTGTPLEDHFTHEIPVHYLPQHEDFLFTAQHHSIGADRLIELHTDPLYDVHFIGFLPGFVYLGGLDDRLCTPRKSVPSRKLEAGSVAIGGRQTGIYPQASPGGWRVIGKTSTQLFDPSKSPPMSIKAGDFIRFVPV